MVTELTDKELLEDLRRSPRGQELVAERQKARLSDRKRWVAEMAKLSAGHEKELPGLIATEDAALAKVREAVAAVQPEGESVAKTV